MLPKTEKDEAMIEKARSLQGVCWGDEYERMIGGMLYVVLLSAEGPYTNICSTRIGIPPLRQSS